MLKNTSHRRLPNLQKLIIRQCIVIGTLIVVLVFVSLSETASISDNIHKKLGELQEELVNTQQQFNTHLAWNNLTHQISLDATNFQLEFELLTIDPDHSIDRVSAFITRLRQHYEILVALPIPTSQQDNFTQLKSDLWTLEGIGLELLESPSSNARLWLYRDSIEFVDAIKQNTLSINAENRALSEALKQRIDGVVEQSRNDQNKLKKLLDRHELIIIVISCASFAIILIAFILLFKRLRQRIVLLEQYAEDIARQDYKRPPFSSKDITGRLAIRMGLMARTIHKGLITLQKSSEEIEELAYYDSLTGLENRRMFNQNVEKAALLSHRYKESYALLYLDLDSFKDINDKFGHDAGDIILKTVAERLRENLREEDSVARLGGDEFAILSRNNSIDNTDLANRILKALRVPITKDGHKLKITSSLGIAILGEDADNLSDLMRYADMALYKAKESGRNTYHYFSEQLESIALKKAERIKDLTSAIENDQLELFYQTQHEIIDNRVSGVEALVRWPHPEEGLIFPEEFIPLAEECGLIFALGEWIINRACRDGKFLNQRAGSLTIAINLSAKQFEDPALLDKLVSSCQAHGLARDKVELEITESLLIDDMEGSVKTLEAMRKKGFRIALDDFGTGYSSLFYLKNLPVNSIKIDKSFTAGLPSETKDSAIVNTTILLAHTLNLSVVAEGIETEDQLAYLQLVQCDTVQGYLLGKPQPLESLVEFLEKYPKSA